MRSTIRRSSSRSWRSCDSVSSRRSGCGSLGSTSSIRRIPLAHILMTFHSETKETGNWVVVQFGVSIHRLRDERLPKGPRFASESLDADTASGSVFPKLTHYPQLLWLKDARLTVLGNRFVDFLYARRLYDERTSAQCCAAGSHHKEGPMKYICMGYYEPAKLAAMTEDER